MCVIKSLIFTVFICASLAISAAYYIDIDTETFTVENISVSTRDVISWTPGKLEKTVNIGGENIYFRVKNGMTAEKKKIPYQVSFRRQVGNSHWFVSFCGGSLIDTKAVLTAAHCFRDPKPCDACCMDGVVENGRLFHVYAVAGSLHSLSHFHGNNDTEEYGQWRLLQSGFFPTNFKFPDNDIAVMITKSEFIYNVNVQAIPMSSSRKDYDQDTCYLSGFGKTEGGVRQKLLQFAEVRVMNSKACDKIHSRKMEKCICSSDVITQGDAGGPLVCKGTMDPNEDKDYGLLVGVAVTSNKKEAKQGSLFTRVSSYYSKFIQKRIKGDSTQPHLSRVVLSFSLFSVMFRLLFGMELLIP